MRIQREYKMHQSAALMEIPQNKSQIKKKNDQGSNKRSFLTIKNENEL